MHAIAGFLLRLATALLLFCALGTHRYSFFQNLRLIVTATAAIAAIQAYNASGSFNPRSRVFWFWCFIGCAILFNPVLPVRFDRASWKVLDAVAGLLFLISVAADLWSRRALARGTRSRDAMSQKG